MEVFCEDLARQNTAAHLVIAVAGAGWVFGQGLDYLPACQA
jgi:hypothetical protein